MRGYVQESQTVLFCRWISQATNQPVPRTRQSVLLTILPNTHLLFLSFISYAWILFIVYTRDGQTVAHVPQATWTAFVHDTQQTGEGAGSRLAAHRAGSKKQNSKLGRKQVLEWHSERIPGLFCDMPAKKIGPHWSTLTHPTISILLNTMCTPLFLHLGVVRFQMVWLYCMPRKSRQDLLQSNKYKPLPVQNFRER